MAEEKTAGSIIIFSAGVCVAGIGWLIGVGADPRFASAGSAIEALGAGLVVLGIIVELFSIGSTLRRISRQLAAGGMSEASKDDDGPRLPPGYMDVPKE
ncbi:MAG: hypothetical protein KGL39_44545 [Patescibacteria group bacterium]|nr:hypothetical protein [Patescibacteria group bacterium]